MNGELRLGQVTGATPKTIFFLQFANKFPILVFFFVFRPYEDQETVILRGHGGSVYGSCFFTDTRYLLSCSEDTSGSYYFTASVFPSCFCCCINSEYHVVVYVGHCS